MTAFAGTAGVFVVMASLATVIKRDLSGMGKWLFMGVLVLLLGSVINIFVGSTAGMLAISTAAIGIFSAYMLYDIKQIIDGGETNYISATLALYLDVYNVFQSLLALLGIFGGERDSEREHVLRLHPRRASGGGQHGFSAAACLAGAPAQSRIPPPFFQKYWPGEIPRCAG